MSRLRVAVIGTGHLGKAHARILSGMPEFELVAVVDSIAERAREVAAQYGARPIEDIAQLPELVHAAIVATPTTTHKALAERLLEAGLHLFVEKPLADQAAAAERLVSLAARQNVVLQVGHVERFNPALAAALPYVRDPKYIDAVRTSGFTCRSTDIGVVLDLMIHDIDLALSLVRSPVIEVHALGIGVFGRHEDAANARLLFANGCVATLSASRISYAAQRRMHVWTPRGFAALDFATRQTTIVQASDAVLRRELNPGSYAPAEQERFRAELFETHLHREQPPVEPLDQLTAELQDFGDCIRQSRVPRVSGAQGASAVAVAELVLEAIERHAWNGTADGPHGSQYSSRPRVIPAPHWMTQPRPDWKQAG
ncbi:MAG: Gfo/Idh/MocA family oxidoreductase [Pirellulales bacterium]|nr:Gfo/Idh/MocA family oxidoreductase [Pirellulales bacterium]